MRRILVPLALALCAGCHVGNNLTDAAASAGTSAFYYQSGGTATLSGKSATVSTADESAVCVANGGTLNLASTTLLTSGSTSSVADSVDVGLDAAVLAKSASTINLASCSVSTSGTGAAGVFATGSGSAANLSGVTVMTTGAHGLGVAATLGGALSLAECTLSTAGADAAAVGMYDGTGTVTVTGGSMTTSGTGSPVIHSQGAVSVQDGTLTASASDAAEIQGGHSITLTGSALSSTGTGSRAVLIHPDSGTAKAAFTMTAGSLSAASGPLFFVTGLEAAITLQGVALGAGSGVLVEVSAGSATLAAVGQAMAGNLVTDDDASAIAATLSGGSTLRGVIDRAALSLDAASSWTLTGTSRLTTLADAAGISAGAVSNIAGNGHSVTYDATLAGNAYLAGATYTLAGGGQLLPE